MKRTIPIKLKITSQQATFLLQLQKAFNKVCNLIVPIAVENRCWNRVALHRLAYYPIRLETKFGSQMVCNAIKTVCDAYNALKIKKNDLVPAINFKMSSSVHFDKRTYSLKDDTISLYTLSGRIIVPLILGDYQKNLLLEGIPKEAELTCKKGVWFFNLVLDVDRPNPIALSKKVLGVDLGENNIAATSSGKLFGGGKIRHERDRALAFRRRLQSNGSKSSIQLLKKISGRESRHVTHINHVISKAIVEEAITTDCGIIALEKLTNIRKHIKAGKRMRSRLHRWSWAQLQNFIQYKAEAAGLKIVFVNPAYTSKTCSNCGHIGNRSKHTFICKLCGIRRHSDLNASYNIRRIALSADSATGTVNYPHVATTSVVDYKATAFRP